MVGGVGTLGGGWGWYLGWKGGVGFEGERVGKVVRVDGLVWI